MTSCHGCHPGVWLDEENRPCWQHSDVSDTASQFEPVFRQKFGPGPLQYRKKIFSRHLSLVKLKTLVRLNLDVEWHAHGHNQRETVSFVRRYLIAWINETQNTDRKIISFGQINVSRGTLVATGRLCYPMILRLLQYDHQVYFGVQINFLA